MGSAKPAAAPFRFQLDAASGVPVYRQLIDQVLVALSRNALKPGDQLPTVRQVAVDLSININTVIRAYKELEIRGVLASQQGTGTFITEAPAPADEAVRQRRLHQLVGELVARAGAEGYSVGELRQTLLELFPEQDRKNRN